LQTERKLKITFVIPTYNEAENLPKIVTALFSLPLPELSLLIVDDNSPDGSGEIAEDLSRQTNGRVQVMHRSGKLGLGTAYIQGFKHCLQTDAQAIGQMDADFSHDPSVLPVFLEVIQGCDLVIGSRYLNGVSVVNWPIRRLMLSVFASLYTRTITGLPVKDCTSGFKCFRRSTIEAIDLDSVGSDGYSFQIEMNYRCMEKGLKIVEVPIIFIDRHAGTSKMSKKIVREAVLLVWKLKLGTLMRRLMGKG